MYSYIILYLIKLPFCALTHPGTLFSFFIKTLTYTYARIYIEKG